MIAYHITKKHYEEGEIYSVRDYDGESCYHRSLSEKQKRINEIIDQCRPQNEPSRKMCFYAFENIDYCYGFVDSPIGYNLYQVEINTCTPRPMCLIDFLNRHIKLLQDLSYVYWDKNLSHEFNVKEYMGTEIRIIDRIDIPQNNTIHRMRLNMDYNHDKDVCCSICRRKGIKIDHSTCHLPLYTSILD
ncbi:MAG: hypothetical protein AUK64_2112 [bacterium P201]|nr:MAG: hypothetical protein AUK64_2112 [bacterium P201]